LPAILPRFEIRATTIFRIGLEKAVPTELQRAKDAFSSLPWRRNHATAARKLEFESRPFRAHILLAAVD
jgi:hypothetical protein